MRKCILILFVSSISLNAYKAMKMRNAYFLQFSHQVQCVLRECNQHVPQNFTEFRKFMDDDRNVDKKNILKNLISTSVFYRKGHIVFLPIYMPTYDIGFTIFIFHLKLL